MDVDETNPIQFIPMFKLGADKEPNCLRCGHLVEGGKVFPKKCHYTNPEATNNCPAESFRIGVGVDVEKVSDIIKTAWDNRNLKVLIRQFISLKEFNQTQVGEVLEAVGIKLAADYEFEEDQEAEDEVDGDVDGPDDAEELGGDPEVEAEAGGENAALVEQLQAAGDVKVLPTTITPTPVQTASAPATGKADDDEWKED